MITRRALLYHHHGQLKKCRAPDSIRYYIVGVDQRNGQLTFLFMLPLASTCMYYTAVIKVHLTKCKLAFTWHYLVNVGRTIMLLVTIPAAVLIFYYIFTNFIEIV